MQHLAKTRTRMIEEDLPVPPPLKRGGKTRISTASTITGRGSRSARFSGIEPITSSSKANGRRPATQNADSAAYLPNGTSSKASKAKGKAKKACKSMSYEDIESEEEEEFDDDSDGEYGKPVPRLTNVSGKGAGKGMGRRVRIEESSEEEGLSESSKAGEKRKRSALESEVAEPDVEGNENSDGEDSDDKTISAASGEFVGNNASFLPAESVASSPALSKSPKPLIVTLKWGKAYPTKRASNALALAKLIEGGIVEPEYPEIYRDAEEGGEEDKDVIVPPFGSAVTPFKIEEDEDDNANTSSRFDVAFSGPAHLNDTVDANMTSHLNAAPAPTPPHFNNIHAGQQSLDFCPGNFHAQPFSNVSVVDAGFYQAPVEMNFPPVPPKLILRSNFNPGIRGCWSGDFHNNGNVALDIGSSNHGGYTHGGIQEGFLGHGFSRYDSDNTNDTQSSSTNGSFVTNLLSNAPTAHQVDPKVGAVAAGFEADEQMPGPNAGHFDHEVGDKEFHFDDIFDFNQVH